MHFPDENHTSSYETKRNIKFLVHDHLLCLSVKYAKNVSTHTTKLCKKKSKKYRANKMSCEQNITGNEHKVASN